MKRIDAHIHADKYSLSEQKLLFEQLGHSVEAIIAVSMDEQSCTTNLELARQHPRKYYPAFGYHPELAAPDEETVESLLAWIRKHRNEAVAIGEVGLPYYNRTEAIVQGKSFDLKPFITLLDQFIALSVELDKPIVLHAVYEDADMVCDLLEKHGVAAAHFHWFKGSAQTVQRMVNNGYYISITPDVCYEEEIRELVRSYPIGQMMIETDGPWPFEGPFTGKLTLPSMVKDVAAEIAVLKGMDTADASDILYENTRRFYRI
jgi:TatD DNase family protein